MEQETLPQTDVGIESMLKSVRIQNFLNRFRLIFDRSDNNSSTLSAPLLEPKIVFTSDREGNNETY